MERTKKVLAVDPGLHICGVALFEDGELSSTFLSERAVHSGRDVGAWLEVTDLIEWVHPPQEIDELVVEMMVIRARKRLNTDDLLQLVGVAGVLAGRYSDSICEVVRPEHWKGVVKKRIHHPRVIRALQGNEPAILDRYMRTRFEDGRCAYSNAQQYIAACERCTGNDYPEDPIHNVMCAIGLGLYRVGRRV